jgi:hypothetical protein
MGMAGVRRPGVPDCQLPRLDERFLMGSVVIGDQRSLDRFGGGSVVPDGDGHGQQPLGDAHVDAAGGAAAVAFEVELAFEGVIFDQHIQCRQEGVEVCSHERPSMPFSLVLINPPRRTGPGWESLV